MVTRQALLRKLRDASQLRQLIVVRAAAGAGKTVLLSQWSELMGQMQRPFVWLTLEAGDAGLSNMLGTLAEAYRVNGYVSISARLEEAVCMATGQAAGRIAQHLAVEMNKVNSIPMLILDRFEVADSFAIAKLLEELLRHVPRLQIMIATRRRPRLPVGDLASRDQLLELEPEDLVFSPRETHEALDGAMPEIYARRLHAKVSGSPIALAFARRALAKRAGMPFERSWNEALSIYYRSEILSSLDPELLSAVSRLVIVEQFDLSLASALIGEKAPRLIDRLYHETSVLLRDRFGRDFHFPETLRYFFRASLDSIAPEPMKELHKCAADWFADRHMFAEAMGHAILAQDRQSANRYFSETRGMDLITREGVSVSHSMLDSITTLEGDGSANAHLSRAMICAHQGRLNAAEDHLGVARLRLEEMPCEDAERPTVEADLLLSEGFVKCFEDKPIDDGKLAALERLAFDTPSATHGRKAQANIILCSDRFYKGDLADAGRFATQAALLYAGTEGVHGSIFTHFHQSLLQYWQNDLQAALTESAVAEQMVRLFFPADVRLCSLAEAMTAGIRFELAQPEERVDWLDLVARIGALESWPDIQIWSHAYAVRAMVGEGLLVEARAIVENGLEVGSRLQNARIEWNMRLLKVLVETRSDDIDAARAEAQSLGILDFDRDDADPNRTWQERISGRLVGAGNRMDTQDFVSAEHLLEIAGAELRRIPIGRLTVALEIAKGRLAALKGDAQEACRRVAAAKAFCPSRLPVQLFLAGGPELRPFLGGIEVNAPAELKAVVPEPHRLAAQRNELLTAREQEVVLLLGEGNPNKVTAYRLGLSEATVRFHLRNIYRKLSVQNRTQALARYRALKGQDEGGGWTS